MEGIINKRKLKGFVAWTFDATTSKRRRQIVDVFFRQRLQLLRAGGDVIKLFLSVTDAAAK
jgi:hypothetical protein